MIITWWRYRELVTYNTIHKRFFFIFVAVLFVYLRRSYLVTISWPLYGGTCKYSTFDKIVARLSTTTSQNVVKPMDFVLQENGWIFKFSVLLSSHEVYI